eukprot:scaffold44771_cov20-Tisochrysis_lutea.AAC.1
MYPLHQEQKKKTMGIGRMTSSTLCLIFVMRVERSLLKSVSGANGVYKRTGHLEYEASEQD